MGSNDMSTRGVSVMWGFGVVGFLLMVDLRDPVTLRMVSLTSVVEELR